MRKGKHFLMAAVLAATTLGAGAAPRPLAAESAESAASATIADGWYLVVDPATNQRVGWVRYENGVVVEQSTYIEVVGQRPK
ncbi:MAG TPA: hypothetical protein VHG51_11295 [Longimicrobiaceae bacterium]|nr:hypothetical protein [Longimicrobiaceae bacterium]